MKVFRLREILADQPGTHNLAVSLQQAAAPTSTTRNMTGFLAKVRGFSITNESTSVRLTIGGSNRWEFPAKASLTAPANSAN